jgi:hypothetical protein
MMRTLIFVLLIVGAGVARAGSVETIKPGYWESQEHVSFPANSSKVDRRCITPKDVAKVLEGPRNHIYECVYPEHFAADGKIGFKGTCVDKNGLRVRIEGHGAYTETTLQMSAVVRIGPLAVTASTDAHRLGDVCPAGAPGAPSRTDGGL